MQSNTLTYLSKALFFLLFFFSCHVQINGQDTDGSGLEPPFEFCESELDTFIINPVEGDKIFVDIGEPVLLDAQFFVSSNTCVPRCMKGGAPGLPAFQFMQFDVTDDNGTIVPGSPFEGDIIVPDTIPTDTNIILDIIYNQNLDPGIYTVTATATVCLYSDPVISEGGDDMSLAFECCIQTEPYTFTLCVNEPVPTLSEWGVFIFALGMVILGVVFLYNRRYQLNLTT